jgi:hypothetical protein
VGEHEGTLNASNRKNYGVAFIGDAQMSAITVLIKIICLILIALVSCNLGCQANQVPSKPTLPVRSSEEFKFDKSKLGDWGDP